MRLVAPLLVALVVSVAGVVAVLLAGPVLSDGVVAGSEQPAPTEDARDPPAEPPGNPPGDPPGNPQEGPPDTPHEGPPDDPREGPPDTPHEGPSEDSSTDTPTSTPTQTDPVSDRLGTLVHTPTPTPTPTEEPTATPTPTPTPTDARTSTDTVTPTPEPPSTPTSTGMATPTPTSSPSPTPSVVPGGTKTPTAADSRSRAEEPSPTSTLTLTVTETGTPTDTPVVAGISTQTSTAVREGQLDVINASIPVDFILVGRSTTVQVTVENPSSQARADTLTVTFEGSRSNHEVVVGGGETVEIELEVTFDRGGRGPVTVNGVEAGELIVESADREDTATPAPVGQDGFEQDGFGGLTALLAVLLLTLYVRLAGRSGDSKR